MYKHCDNRQLWQDRTISNEALYEWSNDIPCGYCDLNGQICFQNILLYVTVMIFVTFLSGKIFCVCVCILHQLLSVSCCSISRVCTDFRSYKHGSGTKVIVLGEPVLCVTLECVCGMDDMFSSLTIGCKWIVLLNH